MKLGYKLFQEASALFWLLYAALYWDTLETSLALKRSLSPLAIKMEIIIKKGADPLLPDDGSDWRYPSISPRIPDSQRPGKIATHCCSKVREKIRLV